MKAIRFLRRAALGVTIICLPLTAPPALDLVRAARSQSEPVSANTARHAATHAEPAEGDFVHPSQVRLIDRPGVFGLSDAPDGDSYALIGDRLARIDPQTGQIMSILRKVALPTADMAGLNP